MPWCRTPPQLNMRVGTTVTPASTSSLHRSDFYMTPHLTFIAAAKSAPETPRRPDASYTSRQSSVSTVFSFTESMEQDLEAKAAALAAPETFKPHKKEWLIMISLAFISFMVSLDATILVTVLPVC
jgi:hypothetical protein